MTQDRIALVLGATGGVGGETARALSRHGWRVRALAREVAKARDRVGGAGAGWDWHPGDAMDRSSVVAAADGASLILHGVNPPGYRNWAKLVVPMIDNTIAAARASGARVMLPGTIYNFGPDAFPVLREDSPQHPATRKGALRVEMERRLETAAAEGVRALVLRAGDFFGPNAGNNWFSEMVKGARPLRAVTYPGRAGIGHAWAYLPDLAETFARLAEREADLAPFERLHFAGDWDPDGTAMTSAIARAAGDGALKIRPLPWALLPLLAPFNETIRELLEMKPFWRTPAPLDNAKLVSLLGAEPHTPLDQAVAAALKGQGALA